MKSKKILVIEDDETYQSVITRALVKEGYTVYQARRGDQGSVYTFQILPDLVLCDVVMEQGDGFTVLSKIRADPRTSSIPVIIMTGWGSKGGLRQAMSLGADDYLQKPFTSSELLASIRARLDRNDLHNNKISSELRDIRTSLSNALPQELRSPLTTILGFASLLSDESSSLSASEVRDIAQQVSIAGNQIDKISESISIYSDLTYIKHNGAPRRNIGGKLDTQVLVDQVRKFDQIRSQAQRIRFELPHIKFESERSHVTKAFFEIIHNALVYSYPNSPVHISGVVQNNMLVTCFKNEGPGFSPSEISRIAPFLRFDRDVSSSGLGLGISIAKLVTDIYSGAFSIDSQDDGIVRVFLTLPIAE